MAGQPLGGNVNVLPGAASSSGRKSAPSSSSTIVSTFKLSAGQSELVRMLAQKENDRLVMEEEKELEVKPKYKKRKKEVERQTEEKIVTVRQKAEVRRAQATPEERTEIDAEVAQEIQQVEAEKVVEQEKLQAEIHDDAIQLVQQKYGSNIAVPLETGFDVPVVAFATVDSRGIVAVAEDAYQLDSPPEENSDSLDDAILAFIEDEEYILVATVPEE